MESNNPIYDFLKDSKGVIHIGASTGQERDIYADMNLPVIWIEAGIEEFEELQRHILGFHNQRAYNALVGKRDGETVTFYRSNNSYSNSIFKLAKHKDIWPDVYFIDHETRVTTTLGTLLENEDLTKYDTLILDVQGAELLVLEGAVKLLNKFKYIRCEASDSELYEGQCLDHNLDIYLLQQGFSRINIWKIAESTDEIGIFEVLYQNETTKKNCQIIIPEDNDREVWARVGVLESKPRLGFRIHHQIMFKCFGMSGFPVADRNSAFWEQAMQQGMNDLIRHGCDWIITVDYDSVFDQKTVQALLYAAAKYPEADAIASWQLQRNDGTPRVLNGWHNADGTMSKDIPVQEVINQEVTKVSHTVFGLTLIKTKALLDIPKPWFQSFPNADGEWEDGKTDADGYFWKKWREYGKTIYSANDAKIGHLDEVILWITDDLQPIRQSIGTYYREGRPF